MLQLALQQLDVSSTTRWLAGYVPPPSVSPFGRYRATLALASGALGRVAGKGSVADCLAGWNEAWYSSSCGWMCSSCPPHHQILTPLSTRNLGDRVAVRMYRPHGDHSQWDELEALPCQCGSNYMLEELT